MKLRFLALFGLLIAAPASADTLEGSWALEIGGTAIFRFDIAKDGEGKWHATWAKPGSFASDGDSFSHLAGPAKEVPSMTALETPDGIEVSFDDPRPGAVPDIFDFKPIDDLAVEMLYVGTDLAPYTLQRVKPDTQLGPWDPDATYTRKPAPEPEAAPEQVPDPLPSDADSFRLKPGAPVGR